RPLHLIVSRDQSEPNRVALQRQLELARALFAELGYLLLGRSTVPQSLDLFEHRALHLLHAVGRGVERDLDRVNPLRYGMELGPDVDSVGPAQGLAEAVTQPRAQQPGHGPERHLIVIRVGVRPVEDDRDASARLTAEAERLLDHARRGPHAVVAPAAAALPGRQPAD